VARAEAAALDPNADIHQVIRINNLANRILRSLGFKFAPQTPKARGLEVARQRWAENAERAKRDAEAKPTETPDG
jgi:hypothetical protein